MIHVSCSIQEIQLNQIADQWLVDDAKYYLSIGGYPPMFRLSIEGNQLIGKNAGHFLEAMREMGFRTLNAIIDNASATLLIPFLDQGLVRIRDTKGAMQAWSISECDYGVLLISFTKVVNSNEKNELIHVTGKLGAKLNQDVEPKNRIMIEGNRMWYHGWLNSNVDDKVSSWEFVKVIKLIHDVKEIRSINAGRPEFLFGNSGNVTN